MSWRAEVIASVVREVSSFDVSEGGRLHGRLLQSLHEMFTAWGWASTLEYKVEFGTVIRTGGRAGMDVVKPGYIDLVAQGQTRERVSIEFDNTNVLKYKSIEKIMQQRGLAIGISAARKQVDNRERFLRVIGERGWWRCSDFWMMEMAKQRAFCWIREEKIVDENWEITSSGELL